MNALKNAMHWVRDRGGRYLEPVGPSALGPNAPKLMSLALAVLMIAAVLVGCSLVVTRILSGVRSYPAARGAGREPPVAPYWVPFLQHLPGFLSNPGKIMTGTKAWYPDTPFTLLMAGTKFHVYNSRDTVSHVFRRSRAFAFEPVIASMMENALNLPEQDRPLFYLPSQQARDKEARDSAQFVSANHNTWLKYLSGRQLDEVMSLYTGNLDTVLARYKEQWQPGEWVSLDLHEFMQRIIFDVSAVTFFGTRINELWPSMWEDWKVFNDAAYIGVRSDVIYRLDRRAGAARERMICAFEEWVQHELDHDVSSAAVWDKDWGYVMNRERELLGRRFGFSLRGRAILHASFLFVIVANSAPMATWFAWCASKPQDRLRRYRREVRTALPPGTDPAEAHIHLDRNALRMNPYVQGVWKEALRLGTASAAARVVMEDAELEGFVAKRGSVVLMPVALMHYDEELFPEPHEVVPERWVAQDPEDEEETGRLRRRNFALRSFGGGTGLCSGRFVAEDEVLLVVSAILLMCDVEFGKEWDRYEFNPRALGIMSPAKHRLVRIRTRSGSREEDGLITK